MNPSDGQRDISFQKRWQQGGEAVPKSACLLRKVLEEMQFCPECRFSVGLGRKCVTMNLHAQSKDPAGLRSLLRSHHPEHWSRSRPLF